MKLIHGDCLEEMKHIGDGSIDMVLTDPPYGTVEGIDNVNHGMAGKTEWDVALNPADFWPELNRVLRPNGALILFSQEPYTSRLIVNAHGCIPFGYRMIWGKDHFANALVAKKAPVSYYEDICLFFKSFDDMQDHPMQNWFCNELELSGFDVKQLCKLLETTNVSHYFTKGRQFRIPNREKLAELQKITGFFEINYDDMRDKHKLFHAEQRAKYPKVFNLPEGKKVKSNVLQYKKDYDGHHPTQKPVALIEDLIKTYTNEGNMVLDFTMGSGTTGVACERQSRGFIGIEKDDGYYDIACKRINDEVLARG